MPDFVSLEEAAEQLGVDQTTLVRWIRKGHARATRRGGAYLLTPPEVKRLQDSPQVETSLELPISPKSGRRKVEADELLEKMQARLERLEEMQSRGEEEGARGETDLEERIRRLEQELETVRGEKSRLELTVNPLEAQLEKIKARTEILLTEKEVHLAQIRDLERQLRGQLPSPVEAEEIARLRQELHAVTRQKVAFQERYSQMRDQFLEELELLKSERDEFRDQMANNSDLQQELVALGYERNELRADLESAQQKLSLAQSRIEGLEKELRHSEEVGQGGEELERENRRLKERLNDLQYKLDMGGGGSLTESREVLDRMANLEELMLEKDQLIQSEYEEKAQLMARVELAERELYELQARYDKEKSEWSALLAREIQNRDRLIQQSYDPTPKTEGRGGWGLFRPKNDTR